jgi:sulfur carrier protein|tara:strand:- start:463 stop:666 length:204 start_codon:yes stop_codon:yes gene_type:complete
MKMYINGSIKEFNGIKITATELIIQLNLNGKRFAIEKNGEIISKNFLDGVYFNEGDKIEIIGAVGGG